MKQEGLDNQMYTVSRNILLPTLFSRGPSLVVHCSLAFYHLKTFFLAKFATNNLSEALKGK